MATCKPISEALGAVNTSNVVKVAENAIPLIRRRLGIMAEEERMIPEPEADEPADHIDYTHAAMAPMSSIGQSMQEVASRSHGVELWWYMTGMFQFKVACLTSYW
jgi:hypothetical protein